MAAMMAMMAVVVVVHAGAAAAWDIGWYTEDSVRTTVPSPYHRSTTARAGAAAAAAAAAGPSLTVGEAWLWAFQYIFLIAIAGMLGWLIWQQQQNTKKLEKCICGAGRKVRHHSGHHHE